MKRASFVVAAVLIAFPILAEQKPTVTPVPARASQPQATPTPDAKRGKPTKEQRAHEATHVVQQMTGKVIRLSGSTFTVLSGGKEVTFSGAKLKSLPKVGEVLDLTYTQTPGGQLEATTVKSSKSNTSC